jgi:hypothetical protein
MIAELESRLNTEKNLFEEMLQSQAMALVG